MSVTVTVKDDATPLLNRVARTISEGALENAMGRGATKKIQAYLFGLNSGRANSLGGKRSNFYSAAAKSTSYQAEPGKAEITISKLGFRQRLEGGWIRAG